MIPMAHRIVLTERCNKKCPHCFNADQRDAEHMDVSKLFEFWHFNRNYLRNAELKLMGGEPTLHPRFTNVCDVGIALFDKISLFTNGSNLDFIKHPDIVAATWTGKMQYIFNGYVFKPRGREWMTFSRYFNEISVHVVIPNEPLDPFLKRTMECINHLHPQQVKFIISGDTGVNIFKPETMEEYRKRYMYALGKIVPRMMKGGFKFSYDHTFPQCFWTVDMLNELQQRHIKLPHIERLSCCDTILGLLDTNFDLWYCNQTRIKICNVFEKDKPRHMEKILRDIACMPEFKCQRLCQANSICGSCPAITTCKAACWYERAIFK